jgi:hypothetical protein
MKKKGKKKKDLIVSGSINFENESYHYQSEDDDG